MALLIAVIFKTLISVLEPLCVEKLAVLLAVKPVAHLLLVVSKLLALAVPLIVLLDKFLPAMQDYVYVA